MLKKVLSGCGVASILGASFIATSAMAEEADWGGYGPFQRISSFLVFENSDVENETASEIVASLNGGTTLVYTDSPLEVLGFVNIIDPANPLPDGVVELGGEPTAVAVKGQLALVGVNTSPDFVNPSGHLAVVNTDTRTIVREIDLGGQPDSVAVSPDGQYAAVVIENERDEDLGDGKPPQLPGGFVVIVDLVGPVDNWSTRVVDLAGVPDLFPEDPEPEFVDINELNYAVVTMQENNHMAVIRLSDGEIVNDFPAGTVDLTGIDTVEDDIINQTSFLDAVPREPDAVAWTSLLTFATADEGDLFGGSRGFTVFGQWSEVLYGSGNSLERITARLGHYPEGRSENKGCEPESVEFGVYGDDRYLFVGSERSSVVFVYDMPDLLGQLLGDEPELIQVLPSGAGPEGLHVIPERNLLVVACEEDARDDKLRSVVGIYELVDDTVTYPSVVSENRDNGAPIPWAALSGLVVDPADDDTLYTVYDSFYKRSRIFTMDVSEEPAVITGETMLRDEDGVLEAALTDLKKALPGSDDFIIENVINEDGSINVDPEGVAVSLDGSAFWMASEGRGNLVDGVSDPKNRPFEYPNLLLQVGHDGVITNAILPPLEVTSNQLRFGYEGVASVGRQQFERVYVCFQREWSNAGDPSGFVRIGCYDVSDGAWTYAHYPLDAAESPNGGWVGLSDLTYIGNRTFAVIERDNQGTADAAVKRLYTFSVAGVDFKSAGDVAEFDVVEKTLVRDLLAEGDLTPTGGQVPEKIEGLAVLSDGTTYIVNDNDGVDDNSGETLLINLGSIFR